jgi:hypothetical protein
MQMTSILCLDTEPETIADIRAKGHDVAVGNLGYRTGIFQQPHPPHEFEIIICDLKKPACYDAMNWGPGGNDNYQCTIVKSTTDETYTQSGSSVPRYKLVHGKQIREIGPKNFDGHAVLNAVVQAGSHVLLMYNPEWARHVSWSFPNFAGLSWTPIKTIANKAIILPPLESILSKTTTPPQITFPIQYSMSQPYARAEALKASIKTHPLVTNTVGEHFGQLVTTSKGSIWIVPRFENNSAFLEAAIASLKQFSQIPIEPPVHKPLETEQRHDIRDVFISHAWEDKDFARPLAEHLKATGITVWFDEYELKLGDSLRRRIEDGLLRSRHGLVLISQTFFQKSWTVKELDALFSLEDNERRILPIWHNVGANEIKRHAPLLADKFAISTTKGIPAIAAEIKRVLGRP